MTAQNEVASGTEIANYVVDEKLGEGGFGAVYRARNRITRKLVAIKILSAQAAAASPEVRLRFRREAAAANEIGHENFVEAYDFGEFEGQPFIVMEFLEGTGLDKEVRERGPMPLERAVPILLQTADALAAAHALGIVHRDIKPENIFLVRRAGRDDFVKVLDLGIAKFVGETSDAFKTRSTAILGSPNTMSPEQCRGARIDHRSDLYSLGVVAFYLLTGRFPFEGEFAGDILSGHMRDAPPRVTALRPDLPPSIDAFFELCLAKSPDQRFASATAFQNAISRFAAPERLAKTSDRQSAVTSAMPVVSASGTPLPVLRNVGRPRMWLATAGALVVVLGGIALFARARLPPPALKRISPITEPRIEPPTAAPAIKPTPVEPLPAEPETKQGPPKVPIPDPVPQSAPLHRPLQAPAARGRIDVFVEPWATVIVDGRRIGDTPVRGLSLSVGTHLFQLENAAHGHPPSHPYERQITIKSGHNESIDLDWTR